MSARIQSVGALAGLLEPSPGGTANGCYPGWLARIVRVRRGNGGAVLAAPRIGPGRRPDSAAVPTRYP